MVETAVDIAAAEVAIAAVTVVDIAAVAAETVTVVVAVTTTRLFQLHQREPRPVRGSFVGTNVKRC